MTEFRCPKCESIGDFDKFGGGYGICSISLCEICRKNNSDEELERFGSIFSDYCYEIFYLRYPNEPHIFSAIIPNDYGERKELIKNKKEAIEKVIKYKKKVVENSIKFREDSKKRNDYNEVHKLNEVIKDFESYVRHLEVQLPLVVQLEQKYKQ